MTPVKRALLSVSDKTGLVPFATRLVAAGVEIVSSGGTAAALAAAGLPVTPVTEVTGTPEMLDGRVKTLHPAIHAGILADVSRPEHVADLEAHGVEPFQLVVVDLYPFEATVADPEVAEPAAVEQIDIGGPTMIRAAAKNHANVAVVTSPGDYEAVAGMIETGGIDAATRRRLAATAFSRTAGYDAAILDWLHRDEPLPPSVVMALDRVDVLRYGENPHQEAAVYRHRGRTGWWDAAELIQGKALSFNNLVDAEAAWRLATQLAGEGAAAVIVKHTNPCGVAVRPGVADAFDAAWECDPLSAFGGVVAVSGPLDEATASRLDRPLRRSGGGPRRHRRRRPPSSAAKPNMRVLVAPAPHDADLDLRRLEDGFVAQRRDGTPGDGDWEVRSAVRPYEAQLADLRLAWKVAAAAKSNSVVIATGGAAVGIGAGDQSRVGAAVRAVAKAGERAHGAVAAGDGFFPFGDGVRGPRRRRRGRGGGPGRVPTRRRGRRHRRPPRDRPDPGRDQALQALTARILSGKEVAAALRAEVAAAVAAHPRQHRPRHRPRRGRPRLAHLRHRQARRRRRRRDRVCRPPAAGDDRPGGGRGGGQRAERRPGGPRDDRPAPAARRARRRPGGRSGRPGEGRRRPPPLQPRAARARPAHRQLRPRPRGSSASSTTTASRPPG